MMSGMELKKTTPSDLSLKSNHVIECPIASPGVDSFFPKRNEKVLNDMMVFFKPKSRKPLTFLQIEKNQGLMYLETNQDQNP